MKVLAMLPPFKLVYAGPSSITKRHIHSNYRAFWSLYRRYGKVCADHRTDRPYLTMVRAERAWRWETIVEHIPYVFGVVAIQCHVHRLKSIMANQLFDCKAKMVSYLPSTCTIYSDWVKGTTTRATVFASNQWQQR